MSEPAADEPGAPSEQNMAEAAQQEAQRTYALPGLEGEWTLDQLVDMELRKDPRLGTVRRSALPPEFWDARRRARNHARLQRGYAKRKRAGEEKRAEEAELLAGMDEEEQAEYAAAQLAQREAAKAAAAEQRERVAEAMQSGLRVVIDCSLSAAPEELQGGGEDGVGGGGASTDAAAAVAGAAAGSSAAEAATVAADGGAAAQAAAEGDSSQATTKGKKGKGKGGQQQQGGASDREVRSLCKQLELCAAANKRAPAPVSLRFTSFASRVRAFAEEGMHADRWPAARGHEEALGQLFEAGELVVLSPDATEPLLELDTSKVYVIGGLVDRTVQKGATLQLARRCGARAVRLPIAEHLGQLSKGRGVLNVNDVFSALLAVHAGQGWRAALEAAIPQRFRQGQGVAAGRGAGAAEQGAAAGTAAAADEAAVAPAGATPAAEDAAAGGVQQAESAGMEGLEGAAAAEEEPGGQQALRLASPGQQQQGGLESQAQQAQPAAA